jgi:alanine dehydrogenase
MGGIKMSGEGGILGQMHPSSWAIPVEKPLQTKKSKKSLRIGVPMETNALENRVSLTPETVGVLVSNGHEVYVQKDAGTASSFSDGAYGAAGAYLTYSLGDIYAKADIIVKISPPTAEELEHLRPGMQLISALNLGSLSPESLTVLMKKNITAIGFEFLQGEDGNLPLVQMMSEIAGVSSIHIASSLLTGPRGGKGLLLGGITGVPPAVVTILGAGTVGTHAARTALGVGAHVMVIDEAVHKLRQLKTLLGRPVYTAVAQQHLIADCVLNSDVVIGAAYKPGQRAPVVVTEDMVSNMREGSVIVDIAIDQGGCVETSRLTTLENPTFTEHGVIHYCVPNIASRVAHTASAAISNILGPLLIQVGDSGGLEGLIKHNEGVKQGVYVHRRHLTKLSLSKIFGLQYYNINLLLASDL